MFPTMLQGSCHSFVSEPISGAAKNDERLQHVIVVVAAVVVVAALITVECQGVSYTVAVSLLFIW
jgi:hypothetical protein